MTLINDAGIEEQSITQEDINNSATLTTLVSTIYVPTEIVDGVVIPDRHFTNGGVVQ
jgi:hypothetical protein